MRYVWLVSVAALLSGTEWTFAQTSDPGDPPAPATSPPTPPASLPPPRPALVPPPLSCPPPGPDPLLPTSAWVDAGLDSFATRFWFGGEYLLWFIKGDTLPPLLTTGQANSTAPGALGQPGTQVLIGGDEDSRVRSGVRFSGGYWFTPEQTIGVDGSFFFLGGFPVRQGDGSYGSPVLARPFYNANTNSEDASIVAYPGAQAGTFTASQSSFLWGADANLRGLVARGASYQISAIGGFRFLDLNESLNMTERDTILPQTPSDSVYWTNSADRFHTSNQFYGGQMGADLMWARGRFFIDAVGKVALGVSAEEARINGSSSYNTSTGQSGQIGIGQMALPSNIGRCGQDQFAVVPEATLNFGYALTRHLRLTIGYSFLYWSNVFRPGEQVDRAVNPTQTPAFLGTGSITGPDRPNFTFKDSDFWAQGLNFGLQFRY